MKKFLLLFALLFVLGAASVYADSYTWEVTKSHSASNQAEFEITANDVTWTFNHEGHTSSLYGARDGNAPISLSFGSQKNPTKQLNVSTDAFIGKKIVSISVNAAKNGANSQTTVKASCNTETQAETLTTSFSDYTFPINEIANGKITLIFDNPNSTASSSSKNGGCKFHSITVVYEEASSSIGWSAENATVYLGDENNKFPTFNNPDNLFIIYDSSDKNVATINDEGNITLVGAGTTTITALDENNIEYTYTLVVERRLDTIFDNNLNNNQGDFTIEDIKLGDGLENAWTTNSYGMTANGYVSGKAHEADSWLISPVIDLRYASETTLSFEHGVQYFTDIETAKTETSFNIREENGDWETVTIPYPEALGNNAVSTGAISLAQYEGKKIQLGFHYTSGATKSGRWQIKNVLIQGYIDEPTLPEGGLDFTVENIENDSFVIGKDVESAKITVSGVHAESELYCKFTAAPAENPESAPRKAVDHTGYEKIERDADNNHTITVDGAGTLELYTYHPATDSKSDIRTINVTKEDGTTAIDSIASDVADGEAEYFNLQGVRINPENAAPGLYIRRQGGKAAKVMVK